MQTAQTIEITSRNGTYPVIIGENLKLGKLAAAVKKPCRVAIISDSTVLPLYGEQVRQELEGAGFDVCSYAFAAGEASKTWSTVGDILNFLAHKRLCRADLVVALGGGVSGDMAGFAASVYLRGIDFIQLPTTLLAAVDSSVGGKTGVDLPSGKNLAGSFYSPKGVFCDVARFASLPKSAVTEGYGEIIKYGMFADSELFATLEEGSESLAQIVARCVSIKAGVVMRDETEQGERQLLNFGHTIGHAAEVLSDYSLPHGAAVAVGMAKITELADLYGLTEEPCSKRLNALLAKHDLPTQCPYPPDQLAEKIMSDKKRIGGNVNLIIPRKVGKAQVYPLPTERLEEFLGGSYAR